MTSKFIPGGDPRQQMQQRQPDLSLATDIVCENCGNFTFENVILMKKVSAILSPEGKEGIVPIPTFGCVACGYINEMFRPVPARSEGKEEETPTPAPKSGLVLEK